MQKQTKHFMSKNKNLEPLMTTDEVAYFLHVSPKTVYQYVYRGLIPHKKLRNNLRFDKDEVVAWLEKTNLDSKGLKKEEV